LPIIAAIPLATSFPHVNVVVLLAKPVGGIKKPPEN